MGLFLTIRTAIRAIGKNKLRASLTVLGVVVGIAAVTTMVSIGQSARMLIQREFEHFGTNVLSVMPKRQMERGVQQERSVTLTAQDADAIQRECPSVLAASPLVNADAQVIYRNSNWRPDDMFGVNCDYLIVRNWPLRQGVFFTEHDLAAAAKVCVIGQTIVTKLFQTTNPIGETIRINRIPFRVVGVLESKGIDITGNDDDDVILMPYTTVRKRLQGSSFDDVNVILVSARTEEQMSDAEREITRLLRERHRLHQGQLSDFEVKNSTDSLNRLHTVTAVLTFVLSAIAAISLVVGGIGIMNIMLVSVTERTREIGIRMALGARSDDIRRQFLIESVVLSSLGGVAGIAAGIAASVGITAAVNSLTVLPNLPRVVSFPAAALAMLFAAAVGVMFGYYPARRASQLDPIEALRYE